MSSSPMLNGPLARLRLFPRPRRHRTRRCSVPFIGHCLAAYPAPRSSRAYTFGHRHQANKCLQPDDPTTPNEPLSTGCPTRTGGAKNPPIANAIRERSDRTKRKRAQRATEPKASPTGAPRTKSKPSEARRREPRPSKARELIFSTMRCGSGAWPCGCRGCGWVRGWVLP